MTRTLHVGDGAFAPVAPEIYEFEVSGLKVVQSWLKYRMKKGAGRKSSPLDDIHPLRWTSAFTTEFLELLWVLEETMSLYPEQENLRKQGAGIRRYAARLKSGSPLPAFAGTSFARMTYTRGYSNY